MNPEIGNILLQLPENKMPLALELRDIVLAAHPQVREIIKWTRITFVAGKNDIAFICSCPGRHYIELGFFKAVYLTDPKNLLEGKGKEIRRIKIQTLKTIPVADIAGWVNEHLSLKRKLT
jgi:hypothetical protein